MRVFSLTGILIGLLLWPMAAGAVGEETLVSQHPTEQLLAAGCQAMPATDEQALLATQASGWQVVVPADGAGRVVVACPAGTVQGITSGSDSGLPLVPEAEAAGGLTGFEGTFSSVATSILLKNPLSQVIAGIFWMIFALVALAGGQLLYVGSGLVSELLVVGNFVNNPAVQNAWPIVLGIANLGFLLALVTIALLTALRLDVGGGVRRLLPRLLIAALLVNFSLVIGGLIIDFSRVLMAVSVFIFGAAVDLSDMRSALLEAADLGAVYASITAAWSYGLVDHAAAALMEATITWVMALGLLVVAVGLIVRYIALLLLLIASPFAFLFMAFPGMQQLSKKWWTTFLRYVIYGPVVIVALALAINVTQTFDGVLQPRAGADAVTNNRIIAINKMIGVALFTTGIVLAATAGKYAGIAGAGVAVAMASNAGKRVRQGSYRGGVAASRAVGRRPVRAVGEFLSPIGRTVLKGARNKMPLGKFIFGAERDEKGNLLEGETSAFAEAGKRMAARTGLYEKGATMEKWKGDMRGAGTKPSDVRRPGGAYTKVHVKDVGTEMKFEQTQAVIDTALLPRAGDTKKQKVRDFERLQTMVVNHHAYNNVKDDQRARISAMTLEDVVADLNVGRPNKNTTATPELEKIDTKDDEYKRLERLVRDIKSKSETAYKDVIQDKWK